MLKNANRWAPIGPAPFLVAALALAAAFALRFMLHPYVHGHFAFMFFTIAAFCVAGYAGIWPALLVVLGGIPLGIYFFVLPYDTWSGVQQEDLVRLTGNVSLSLVGIGLIEWLQRTKYEARLMRQVADTRADSLARALENLQRAEESTRRSEERYRALASVVSRVWYVHHVDRHFEFVDDTFYEHTGLAPGALEGNGWFAAMHPDDVQPLIERWEQAQADAPVDFDFRLRAKDGSYCTFAGRLHSGRDKYQRTLRWIGARDGA